ncbi:MAG: carbohydrate ABC transporter permease [Spirochaetales bacterium]|nr:carbohydrate ABC transporter permease [Spirochaetales bacterium]
MKGNVYDHIFDTVKILFLLFIVAATLLPFINILAISLNDPMDTMKGGIGLLPRYFTWINYSDIFKNSIIIRATINSILRTAIAGLLHTFCTAMVAYTLTRSKFLLRIPIAMIYIFTMYIDGGLIPTFFLYRALGLVNSFHVYWIPGLTSAWNLLVIRTYIKGLPESLIESAQMEGANEFYIFMRIILPLSMPVLATIILFTAVWHWNYWWDTFIFNSSDLELTTLQYELMKKIQSANASFSGSSISDAFSMAKTQVGGSTVTPKSLRAAMTIIVSIPIIMVYPFLQRYFVHGLTIGGVKE